MFIHNIIIKEGRRIIIYAIKSRKFYKIYESSDIFNGIFEMLSKITTINSVKYFAILYLDAIF
jgi:hypothetical protein